MNILRKLSFRVTLLLMIALLPSCRSLQAPTIGKPEGMRVVSYSDKGIEAEIGLRIKNPNRMGFAIYKSGLDVKLNGIDVGEARLGKKVRVKPTSEDVHYFRVNVDFSKLDAGSYAKLLAVVQKRSVNANIKGEIKAGNFFYKKKFPVNINERIDLNRK